MENKGFEFDEKNHKYFYDGREMTGCTSILGILAKPALIGWAAKMAVEHIRDNSDWGEHYLQVYPETLEEAKTVYAKIRDKRAGEGTDAHAIIERYINVCIESFDGKPVDGKNQFSKWAVENVGKFLGSEQKFYSEKLFVAGTADFTFERKDGKRFLGDVKTYKKIWDNIPHVQCAGYAIMAEEMGEEPYYGYCIVNLPPEGELECLWSLNVEEDKKAFLSAVNLYRHIKKF